MTVPGTRATPLSPPAPDAGLVVDPRVGARGPALLALEDGTVFRGIAFGADVAAGGDLVVNTSQTGYQEVCTDPSYAGQVVVMTYPLIGNYGVNEVDVESWRPHVAGFVIRELSPVVSNWRADSSLAEYLERNGIPGIQGIDTRALTRKLRVRGALNGFMSTEGIDEAETEVTVVLRRAARIEGLLDALAVAVYLA